VPTFVRVCLAAPRWRQRVFGVGTRDYLWLDVFLGAMLRGEWDAFEQRLIEGLACEADARAQEAWPDEGLIDDAAAAFRYDRDLITRDETLAWLDRAGITLEDWTNALVRGLLRNERGADLAELASRYRAALAIPATAFAADGICSDDFDRWATTLAGRAAIAAAMPQPQSSDRFDAVARADVVRQRYSAWLEGLDVEQIDERLRHIAQLEQRFSVHVRAATTTDALASQVARNRMDWTRVDLERLLLDSENAAREAVCCVREDGLSLIEVAMESGRAIRDTRVLLESLEPELQDAVLSAGIDQLLGPIAVDAGYEVVWVAGKATADLGDPLVRARAEAAVVEQVVSRAVLSHVRWWHRPRT
jgi:hypothetical protein